MYSDDDKYIQMICINCHQYRRLTVDLQVAAVLLRPASQNQVVVGFDLKVLPLVLVLMGTEAQDPSA